MLISKEVKVKSSKYYKSIGYEIYDKYITINISDLPIGSSVIILAKCDYCYNDKEISYRDYNSNIKNGGKYACSIKCGSKKAKESNIKKFGKESHLQLDDVKEKIRDKIIENWGVDHISKSKDISKRKSNKMKLQSNDVSKRLKLYYKNLSYSEIEKINDSRKNTVKDKYGVDYISKLDSIKEKTKNTFYSKWGGFTLLSDELKEKVKKTNIEKWGSEYPSQSDIIKDKTKKSNLEKWGFEYPSQSDAIKQKQKNTLLENYNVVNIMFSKDFRNKFIITNEIGYLNYLGDRIYEFHCNICNDDYNIDYDNFYKRKLRNVNTCTNCFPILENRSIKEKELFNFIKSIYKNDIIESYRDGLEIDVYLPDVKIGFEFNGIYWHSNDRLERNYHLKKTNYFKERGIRIIHVWEDDWDFKRDIVKSQISNLISLPEKIFARKCELKEVTDTKLINNFLNNNHIQGYIRSSIKIGLYYKDELVSLMTFDTTEGRNKMEIGGWNLSRFCSKLNYNIIGGASKLLKYFIKMNNPKRIISFADKDWSTGNLYYKLGFKLIKDIKPDYKFIIDNKRINKQRLTRKKLIKLGNNIDLTTNEILESMNISKIYNVGQLKFELIL